MLVWKLDRFSRNRYDSAIYKKRLKNNNVRVMSAMENITDTPEGVLIESVLEGFAEYFSRDLSQKVQRSMRETAKKAAENQHGGHCKAMKRYLLFQKLYCGYCHNKMLGECGKSTKGTAYHYYACMGRKKKHICTHKNIKKDDIENYVMNAVYNLFNDEYAIDKILETADSYQRNNTENLVEIKDLECRISDINDILKIISEPKNIGSDIKKYGTPDRSRTDD